MIAHFPLILILSVTQLMHVNTCRFLDRGPQSTEESSSVLIDPNRSFHSGPPPHSYINTSVEDEQMVGLGTSERM